MNTPPHAIPRRQLRLAAWCWLTPGVLVAWLYGQYRAGVIHPPAWAFAALLLGWLAGFVVCNLLGAWAVFRGPNRGRAGGRWLLGSASVLALAALFAVAPLRWQARDVRPTAPAVTSYMAWVNVAELGVPWAAPRRLESDRLVMFFGDAVTDPERDLAAMDAHVAGLEALTGRPLRAKIHWVRGGFLGLSRFSTPGFAFGSDAGPAETLDRHELAHSAMNQHLAPGTLPPALLNEGWAEAVSQEETEHAVIALTLRRDIALLARLTGDERAELLATYADPAGMLRLAEAFGRKGEAFSLVGELTDEFWYYHGTGPVYSLGRGFVAYLVRQYGARTFADFYFRVRPGTFAGECQEVFGLPLPELERHFWLDAEKPR